MTRLVLLLTIVISNAALCQVDPAKSDSLARSIASKQKSIKAYQDSFMKVQESTYRSAANRLQDTINQKTSLLAEGKREDQRNKRQIRIQLGILALLVLLVFGLLRIRHKSKQS